MDFAADVRHADAVSIAGYAGDHALKEAAVFGVVERPESQRVEQGDGARAHGENVADDAAHAGRRAFIRLHGGRVVVGLYLHHDRPAAADVHDAGVLAARRDEQAVGRGVEHGQQRLGVLIAAVFAPERAEQAELERVGFAPKSFDNGFVLAGG